MPIALEWLFSWLRRCESPKSVVLCERPALFGTVRVLATQDPDGLPLRVLDVDGTWQSATYLDEGWSELAFPYHRAYECAFMQRPQASRILVLGGGGYAYPKHLLTHHGGLSVDVVEIDPRMTELAREWFFLDRAERLAAQDPDASLRIHHLDARAFLDSPKKKDRYDLIFNDCFAHEKPLMTLTTVEGARALRANLTDDGIYLTNVVSALSGSHSQLIRDVCAALRTQFENVLVLPMAPDEPHAIDNNVVIASDGPLSAEGATPLSPTPRGRALTDVQVL